MTFSELMSVLRLRGWKYECLWILIPFSGHPELLSGDRQIAEFSFGSKKWIFTAEERSCKSGDEVWPEFTGEILLQVDTKLISIINHIYDASGAQIWMD
ncbi:hypothetical protein DXQ87_22810 [Salmonella enterica]|nr:hypothetical protein [Salmonella enterica]